MFSFFNELSIKIQKDTKKRRSLKGNVSENRALVAAWLSGNHRFKELGHCRFPLTYDPLGRNLDFYCDTLWRCRGLICRWSPAADPHYRPHQCRRFPHRDPSSRTCFRYVDDRRDNCCRIRISCDRKHRCCSRSSYGRSRIVCGQRHWIYSRHVCDHPRYACNRRNHPPIPCVCAQTCSSWSRFSCARWWTPFFSHLSPLLSRPLRWLLLSLTVTLFVLAVTEI